MLDAVVFGDAASEKAHALTSTLSTTARGGLGQPSRVLQPKSTPDFWGGTMKFTLAVASSGTTYLSTKFFGGDFADDTHEWRLQVFIGGKIMGWIDQGSVDQADQMSYAPRLADRFYVHTLPLPAFLTAGKTSLEVEIRAMGRLYAYGQADNFFYPMTTASRGIYRAYTHTTPYFTPTADDTYGNAAAPSTRANNDDAAIAKIRTRVLNDQNRMLYATNMATVDAWAYMQLAEGYEWPDSPAYQNPVALTKVCQGIDGRYLAWKKDAAVLTGSDQQWQGFGRVGLFLDRFWDHIQDDLDDDVTPGGTDVMNPGFEAGTTMPSGWHVQGWANKGTASRDTSAAHTGTASLKVAAQATGACIVGPDSRTFTGAGEVTYGAWVKYPGTTGSVDLNILFWTADGTFVGGDHLIHVPGGTTEWTNLQGKVTVPTGATQYEFWVVTRDGATAWFDDVTVTAPPPAATEPIGRRAAYRDMLLGSREYWRQNFRHYTNQAQFTAIGIYQCNRGLALLSPVDAWPEPQAREWLYMAVGLKPWAGSENKAGDKSWELGHDYHVFTPKGLSRELGYVGNYGEINDMLIAFHETVTGGKGAVDDPILTKQIVKLCKTRGYFRHEGEDESGNRAMRLETIIGWRNEHFPGDVAYTQKTQWDGNPLQVAAVLDDPDLVGWAQTQVSDGQLAPELELLHSHSWTRVGLQALVFLKRDLPSFRAKAASSTRLPMMWGQPNVTFTDEVNGCLAVKNGEEVFYASLYWRARSAVNSLARVHLVGPQLERSAVIRSQTAFGTAAPVGTFTVPDWVTWEYAINDANGGPSPLPGGGFPPPGPALHQVYAGQRLPIAQTPPDMDPALGGTTYGVETLLVGKAPFYSFSYAGYYIAMNTTKDQTFTYQCPATGRGRDLVTGKNVALSQPRPVPPLSTVILYNPAERS
ncbi:hypothetical protein ASG95_20310 [Phycicoccus sp. Soil803]|nr:hypothetical protein ASG95_20310 [Phycicoccus sp. Soil803]